MQHSESKRPHSSKPVTRPQSTGNVIGLLNRYQRALLFTGGAVTSLVLLAVTALMLYSQVQGYVAERYAEYSVRKTLLHLELVVREGAMRINVLHEEAAWEQRPSAPQSMIDRFAAQNGRAILQFNKNFYPALVLADVSMQRPAASFAPYLALTEEIGYRIGAYGKMLSLSSYIYPPDLSFISISPAPQDGELPPGAESGKVADIIRHIAPNLGSLADPDRLAQLPMSEKPAWLTSSINPFTKLPVLRLVQPAFYEGRAFIVMVNDFPMEILNNRLVSSRYDEISLILSGTYNIVTQVKSAEGTPDLLERTLERTLDLPPASNSPSLQYRNGLVTIQEPIADTGWSYLYAFSWRTILLDLWPRMLSYTAAMLLVIGFVWTILMFLERKIFRPAYSHSKRIEQSENLNRTIVATSTSGLALLRYPTGEVLLQNQAMQRYMEMASPTDLPLPQRLLDIYPGGACALQQYTDLEFSMQSSKNGEAIELLAGVVRTTYQDEDVLLYNLSDITIRKNAERELADAEAAAQSANKAKSAFLAMMSHEIRTPLNAILGNIELLQRSPLSSEQSERLGAVTASSTYLLGTINDVLDFSKIESEQLHIEMLRFDLVETTRQAAAAFEPLAEKKGLALDLIIDDDLASHYFGDPIRIRQMLMNLLSNAVKFTHTGDILMELYLADEEDADAGRDIIIGVSDTGIGMTAEQQQHLFEPFMQADASIARRFGGTGLGLALCKRITELMQGSIQVISQPGQGATFTIRLPLRPAPQGMADDAALIAPPRPPNTSTAPSVHVLVVDDHPANRELIQLQLAALGYTSDQASNGLQALEMFAAQPYSLVITDINMPNMDGYALASSLRTQDAYVPIVALTADVAAGAKGQGKSAGIDAILIKPVLLDTLERCLNQLVAQPPGRTATPPANRGEASHGALPAQVHQAFTESLGSSVLLVRQAIAQQDMTTLAAQFHLLRGSFSMIHEQGLVTACASMEALLPAQDMAGLLQQFSEFEDRAMAALARRAPD